MKPIRETTGSRTAFWLAAAALGGMLELAFAAWVRPDRAMEWLSGLTFCG